MLRITGQTAGPIGTFFVDTHWWPEGVIGFKKIDILFTFKISMGNAGPFS